MKNKTKLILCACILCIVWVVIVIQYFIYSNVNLIEILISIMVACATGYYASRSKKEER